MRSRTTFWILALAVATVGASLLPTAAEADFRGFLKIPGLPGESLDNQHKDEIDVVSYTQTVGTKACFRAVAVKNLDRASLGLAVLALTEQRVPTMTVALRKVGENPIEPFNAVLENVLIGSVELMEVDGAPIPTERVVLLPRRVTLTYTSQQPDGTPGSIVTQVLTCP